MPKGTAQRDVDTHVISETSIVSRLLAEDKTPWYQKPNLRGLYFTLVPAALGVEMTTGKFTKTSKRYRKSHSLSQDMMAVF